MKFATVCSGINAPGQAWNPLGWEEVFCAEIEAFPCAVLAHHFPTVPNLGDITAYATWPRLQFDLLAGGTPCQSFSVAGLRKGMGDPRGQLTRSFIGIAARYRPRWFLWENVPGVLSSNDGRDFAEFLGGLTGRKVAVPAEGWRNSGILAGIEAAYGIAWRVLDAEFVRVDGHPRAVPQRRERVFLVGHLGGCWQRAAAVLLERESLRGDPAPRREAGKGTTHDVAPCIGASGRGFDRTGETRGQDPVVAVNNGVAHALRAEGFDASEDGTGRGRPLVATPAVLRGHSDYGDGLPCLRAEGGDCGGGSESLIAFSCKDHGADAAQDVAPTLRSMGHDGSHANGGGQVAVAFQTRGSNVSAGDDVSGTIGSNADRASGSAPMIALAIQDARGIAKDQNGKGYNEDGSAYTLDGHATQAVAIGFQPGNLRRGAGAAPSEEVAATLKSDHGRGVSDQAPHVAISFEPRYFTRENKTGGAPSEIASPLRSEDHAGDSAPHVAVGIAGDDVGFALRAGASHSGDKGDGGMNTSAVVNRTGTAVRRLTPVECERLMGMTDNFTLVPIRGKPAADGPRYKALGNSMCVNVMRWIGQRIEMVDKIVD